VICPRCGRTFDIRNDTSARQPTDKTDDLLRYIAHLLEHLISAVRP
jgi:transposase-like protein